MEHTDNTDNTTNSSSGSSQSPLKNKICCSSRSIIVKDDKWKISRKRRCRGFVQRGTRCSRFTCNPSRLCWFHQDSVMYEHRVITTCVKFEELPYDDWLFPLSEYASVEEMLCLRIDNKPVEMPSLESLLEEL